MVKTLKVFGWIFLIIGILGFFNNPVIGLFHVDLVHNLVHLVTGLIFLWVGHKAAGGARATLKTFGWIYLILAILGWLLVDGTGTLLGIVEVNGADNWLHLILGLIFLWAGMAGKKSAGASAGSMNQAPAPEQDASVGGEQM